MARIRVRINFGRDFCGDKECNICYRDGNEARASNTSLLEAELAAYNEANRQRMNVRIEANRQRMSRDATIKFKVDPTPVSEPIEQIKCPRCGGGMVVRRNSYTYEKFLGCRAFPACRGTRQLTTSIGTPPKQVEKKEEKKEPVVEVTLDSLLNRPVSKLVEDTIKAEGEFGSVEFVSKQDSKERKA